MAALHFLAFLTATAFVAVSQDAYPTGEFLAYEDRCCKLGQEWFVTSRERCGPYRSRVAGLSGQDQMNCAALVEVCCIKEKHKKQCEHGKKVARNQNSCSVIYSSTSSSIPRVCCNCCKLGIVAYNSGLSCNLFEKYGSPCDHSFKDCCETRMITVAPTTTSAPPVGDDDIDECAKFPTQLCQHICVNTPGSYRCDCYPGFTLQSDSRTCRMNPIGDRCQKNNPCQHVCVDTGTAIRCKCNPGYILLSDSKSCGDIDECLIGTDNCAPGTMCKNTEGSFKCEGSPTGNGRPINCGVGFVFNPRTTECDDVDECKKGKHHCYKTHQICRNTIGSFYCKCASGFRYNILVNKCQDVNECALNRDTCLQGQTCENTIGSFTCRRSINCGTGYTLDKDSQQCLDDDECELATHNCGPARECRNIPGSFRCVTKTCPQGFRLNPRNGRCEVVNCQAGHRPDPYGRCKDINECVEQPNICPANHECINSQGSYRCRSRLNCRSGFAINDEGDECVDVDECAENKHNCVGIQRCVNRPGTFHCQCPEGYRMNHLRRQCDDIDECRRFGQVCALNSQCKNLPGSFKCICKTGFKSIKDGRQCQDINECDDKDICQHNCRNTWGSYQCTCRPGYQLAADSRSCEDIDECNLWSNRGRLCIGICQNTQGSYECSCPKGYRMMSDGRTCQDIDECALRTANCNGQDDYCINTRGGYKCETIRCPNGFIKAPPRGRRRSKPKDDKVKGRKSSKRKRVNTLRGLVEPLAHHDAREEDLGVLCQRIQCEANNIQCLLNKTKTIQWQHVSLPTIRRLRRPITILNVHTMGVNVYPNVNFQIESGNDGNLFEVRRNETDGSRGILRLLRPIRGRTEMMLRLRMDNRNLYNYLISSHIAFIHIHVTSRDY